MDAPLRECSAGSAFVSADGLEGRSPRRVEGMDARGEAGSASMGALDVYAGSALSTCVTPLGLGGWDPDCEEGSDDWTGKGAATDANVLAGSARPNCGMTVGVEMRDPSGRVGIRPDERASAGAGSLGRATGGLDGRDPGRAERTDARTDARVSAAGKESARPSGDAAAGLEGSEPRRESGTEARVGASAAKTVADADGKGSARPDGEATAGLEGSDPRRESGTEARADAGAAKVAAGAWTNSGCLEAGWGVAAIDPFRAVGASVCAGTDATMDAQTSREAGMLSKIVLDRARVNVASERLITRP